MNIICPNCTFERDIDQTRIPQPTVIATCPRCKHSFRLYKEDGRTEQVIKANTPPPKFKDDGIDDPLPSGAVIPTRNAETKQNPAPSTSKNIDPKNADEENLRKTALDAYKQQNQKIQQNQQQPNQEEIAAIDNPWGQENSPDHAGRMADFYQTTVRVMFSAPRFFSGLSPFDSRAKAFSYFILVAIIQVLIEHLWGEVLIYIFIPGNTNDPQLQHVLQLLAPGGNIAFNILAKSALVTLHLFFDAIMFYVAFKIIVGDKADISLIFLVLAYSAAPALLCLVPIVGSIVGFVWAAACGFIGCRYALRISWAQTAMALVPLYIVALFSVIYLVKAIQMISN